MLDRPLKCYLARSYPIDPYLGWGEPELVHSFQNVVISELRPTQCTVGLREVTIKRRRYRSLIDGRRVVPFHPFGVPIVVGPVGGIYALDRHHALCALLAEGVPNVPAILIDDLSSLPRQDFWSTLEVRGWCNPYDADGQRQHYDRIPTSMINLSDDPYRSLASALRRSGGFNKVKTPHSEFAWANFLRRRLARTLLEFDFNEALLVAGQIARSDAAQHLPGWHGAPRA
jgi:hypothetical protein